MTIFGAILFASLILTSCGGVSSEEPKEENIVEQIQIGGTYSLDAYHKIVFETSSRYRIYQLPLNCGGEGDWSQTNNIINLGPNNSACESTRNIDLNYTFADNKLIRQ